MSSKFLAIPALFLLLSSHILAQNNKANLPDLIARANDTTGINALIDAGIDLINVNNNKATEVFNVALDKSRRINYDYGIASSYVRLGYIEGHEGRNREGIAYTQKALAHFERVNRTGGIVMCYINIGYNFDILGMGDSALHYLLKGIDLLENTKTQSTKLARLYENVGTVFVNRNEFSKALSYSRKAVDLATSMNDSDYVVTAYTGLSNVLLEVKDFQGGLDAAQKAKQFLPSYDDPSLRTKVYSHLAAAYAKLNLPDSAIVYAKRSMQYSASTDPANYIAAGLELSDGYEQKEDYYNLRLLLDTLQQRAEADTSLFHLFSVYQKLARLHFLTGNFKDAYNYQVKYAAFKDSFYSKQNTRTIAEVESRFQWAQKERALSEKQLQLTQKDLALEKSNRNVLYALSGVVILLLVATMFYFQGRNRKRSFALNLQAMKQQQEIEMLQAMMRGEEKERSRIAKDLHDGVAGILAAAKMHLRGIVNREKQVENSEDFRQTMSLLDDATIEVRKTSHNLMPEVLLQHGLDEALRRYCTNVSNDALTIQYDSWGELERLNNTFELSVYRIVQELLNNIIKHSQATEAIVQLNHREGVLSITVEDNGVGFEMNENSSNGIGIQSLLARVDAMNGKMEIDSKSDQGVSVYIELETTGLMQMTNPENYIET